MSFWMLSNCFGYLFWSFNEQVLPSLFEKGSLTLLMELKVTLPIETLESFLTIFLIFDIFWTSWSILSREVSYGKSSVALGVMCWEDMETAESPMAVFWKSFSLSESWMLLFSYISFSMIWLLEALLWEDLSINSSLLDCLFCFRKRGSTNGCSLMCLYKLLKLGTGFVNFLFIIFILLYGTMYRNFFVVIDLSWIWP